MNPHAGNSNPKTQFSQKTKNFVIEKGESAYVSNQNHPQFSVQQPPKQSLQTQILQIFNQFQIKNSENTLLNENFDFTNLVNMNLQNNANQNAKTKSLQQQLVQVSSSLSLCQHRLLALETQLSQTILYKEFIYALKGHRGARATIFQSMEALQKQFQDLEPSSDSFKKDIQQFIQTFKNLFLNGQKQQRKNEQIIKSLRKELQNHCKAKKQLFEDFDRILDEKTQLQDKNLELQETIAKLSEQNHKIQQQLEILQSQNKKYQQNQLLFFDFFSRNVPNQAPNQQKPSQNPQNDLENPKPPKFSHELMETLEHVFLNLKKQRDDLKISLENVEEESKILKVSLKKTKKSLKYHKKALELITPLLPHLPPLKDCLQWGKDFLFQQLQTFVQQIIQSTQHKHKGQGQREEKENGEYKSKGDEEEEDQNKGDKDKDQNKGEKLKDYKEDKGKKDKDKGYQEKEDKEKEEKDKGDKNKGDKDKEDKEDKEDNDKGDQEKYNEDKQKNKEKNKVDEDKKESERKEENQFKDLKGKCKGENDNKNKGKEEGKGIEVKGDQGLSDAKRYVVVQGGKNKAQGLVLKDMDWEFLGDLNLDEKKGDNGEIFIQNFKDKDKDVLSQRENNRSSIKEKIKDMYQEEKTAKIAKGSDKQQNPFQKTNKNKQNQSYYNNVGQQVGEFLGFQ